MLKKKLLIKRIDPIQEKKPLITKGAKIKSKPLLTPIVLEAVSGKPDFHDVSDAFKKYHNRVCAVKIARLRDPSKWKKETLIAQRQLFATLASLGVAKHLSWTNKDKL